MTNDQLLAAWKRKLPNVEPTDQELTAFALGVEVGQVELATQVALVEKCMVAMNENADRGEKAEAELAKLKAQPVQPAPLTDEQIKEMSETIWGSELDYKHEAEIKFARAIEAARTGGAG